MNEGFDVGLEMSGNAAGFRDMIANMSHGGEDRDARHPVASEMAIDWNKVIFNMLTIKGIYGREMYETWYKMTVMLQSGLDISAGDHPPLRGGPLRGRVRGRRLPRERQGPAGVGRRLTAAAVQNDFTHSVSGSSRCTPGRSGSDQPPR